MMNEQASSADSPAPGESGHRPVAQLARAPVSKTGGWGFKSLLACQCSGPAPGRAGERFDPKAEEFL